jgi:hypothetical protein
MMSKGASRYASGNLLGENQSKFKSSTLLPFYTEKSLLKLFSPSMVKQNREINFNSTRFLLPSNQTLTRYYCLVFRLPQFIADSLVLWSGCLSAVSDFISSRYFLKKNRFRLALIKLKTKKSWRQMAPYKHYIYIYLIKRITTVPFRQLIIERSGTGIHKLKKFKIIGIHV